MAQIGEKHLEEIKDFDNDNYDEVVEVKQEVKSSDPSIQIDLISADGRQLLSYFITRFREAHGYDYISEWVKELAVMKSFKERYGPDAGPMIEILFDKYKGIINDGVMTVTAFSKGSKWIQDRLYIELQNCRNKANEPQVNSEGLMGSNDFLKRLSLG
jgi:hypothetical protein